MVFVPRTAPSAARIPAGAISSPSHPTHPFLWDIRRNRRQSPRLRRRIRGIWGRGVLVPRSRGLTPLATADRPPPGLTVQTRRARRLSSNWFFVEINVVNSGSVIAGRGADPPRFAILGSIDVD